MEWKNRGIFFSARVLLLAVLAGCTTAPKNPENPYLGFVYTRSIKGDKNFKQDGIDPALRAYKEQIAAEVLKLRRGKHDVHDRSISKQQEYVKELERPIFIEEDKWKRSIGGNLSKKEKRAVLAYWEANKPLSFDGSECLSDWRSVLLNVRIQLDSDKKKAKKLESEIESLRNQKHFRDALAKVDKLRPYESELADELERGLKKDASDYWIGVRLSEINELRRANIYDGDHEKQVLGLYGKICDDVKAFGSREDFNGVFTSWADLLGENWRRRIVELGEGKKYWEAYGFAMERYRDYVDTLRYARPLRDGLRLKIGKGYLEILDNAVRHYSDLASNAYKLKSQAGKAYVYCCMAKEMYDFTTVAELGYSEETETWYKRISALEENELRPALVSRMARRLVVYDFELDTLGLSKKFRQRCQEKYAPGNNHELGLKIVVDKVALAQLESGALPLDPDDYVVEWSRADFKVKGTVGTPIPKTAYVRTDRIKLVDNPFRKDKSSEFHKLKQVKAQEVDQYSLIESVRGIDLACDMDVYCRHRGQKKALKLERTELGIRKIVGRYGIVTNVTATCSLENVLSKMKYYRPDRPNNTMPRDIVPVNRVIDIPDEDKFKDVLSVSIIQDLENDLGDLIDLYPAELLADSDRDASSGKYLDSLGTVLFYLANLSSTDAAKRASAGKGYEWLNLRDQIADDTEEWCGSGGRWADIKSDEKTILQSLWGECVKVGNEQDGR